MCNAHGIVCADGAWTESFQPNDMTLDGLDSEIREELQVLFPELTNEAIKGKFTSARLSLKQFEAKVLVGG